MKAARGEARLATFRRVERWAELWTRQAFDRFAIRNRSALQSHLLGAPDDAVQDLNIETRAERDGQTWLGIAVIDGERVQQHFREYARGGSKYLGQSERGAFKRWCMESPLAD